jgi:hypothetical protein
LFDIHDKFGDFGAGNLNPGFSQSVSVFKIKIRGMFLYFEGFLYDAVTEGPDIGYDQPSVDVDSVFFP